MFNIILDMHCWEHMQSLVWNQEFGNLFGLSKHFKAKKCSVTSKQFVWIRRIVISSDNHTNVGCCILSTLRYIGCCILYVFFKLVFYY
jgi:hypothetical protein